MGLGLSLVPALPWLLNTAGEEKQGNQGFCFLINTEEENIKYSLGTDVLLHMFKENLLRNENAAFKLLLIYLLCNL